MTSEPSTKNIIIKEIINIDEINKLPLYLYTKINTKGQSKTTFLLMLSPTRLKLRTPDPPNLTLGESHLMEL